MFRSCPTACARRAAAIVFAALLFVGCAPDPAGTGQTGGNSGGSAGAPGAGGSATGDGGAAGDGAGGTGGSASGAAGAAGNAGATGAAATGGDGPGGTTGLGGTAGGAGAGGGSAGAGAGAAGTAGATGGRGGAAGRGGAGGAAGRGGATGTAGRGGASGTGAAGTTGAGGAPPVLKKFVGNIDTRGQIRDDFVMYWNQFTAENAGKWGSVEGTRDRMNWTTLDRMYDYAKQNGIAYKHHNFVWGSQQPGWMSGLAQADQRAQVEEWVRLYCERYPDTPLIDVVNEPPPHTTPSYTAALGGAGASGYDWIAQVFKWAGQYCPKSILILNDYNNVEQSGDNTRTIQMVNAVKSAGAPIHGVGAQAHGCANLSASTVQMYIDKIASQTGLPVYISEYDLNISDDNRQRDVMQSQFTMFWNNNNVAGITLWGYIVGSTWVANSGLMTSSGTMRPAMTWLMDFLGR